MAEFIKKREGESPEGKAHRERANEMLGELYEVGGRDALTGLLNENAIRDRGKTEFARAHRTHHEDHDGTPEHLSVVFIDMNDLKKINDMSKDKHSAGNAALKAIANRIKEIAHRATDVVGRLHGDEFIVMLPDTLPGDAAKLFGNTIYAEAPIEQSDGAIKNVQISAAVGIAAYQPGDKDFEAIMDRADTAMYEAKAKGKQGRND